jgi:predicted nucleic acid-binding protein
VIDASVAAKWFLQEGRSRAARRLLDGDNELIAPSSVIFEVYHAIWEASRAGLVSPATLDQAPSLVAAPFARLVPMEHLFTEAAELSRGLRRPIYDCVYLALARQEDVEVVTADRTMARSARRARIKVKLL